MQNIDLICIGKMNAKYFAEGVAEYQKRLSAFASFQIIELPEENIQEKNAGPAVIDTFGETPFVPQAMLTIASLREDEQKYEKAVEVYENLRSLYPDSAEAATALHCEARVRMKLLRDHGYNQTRVADTIAFLEQGLRGKLSEGARADFESWLAEAGRLTEDEAYKAAKFYDSRTRTRRSALNAYERFLQNHPSGPHADEARARLEELKQEGNAR